MKQPWKFTIDPWNGPERNALADTLTITETGAVKLWLKGKLVGIVAAGKWDRVYINADQGVKS